MVYSIKKFGYPNYKKRENEKEKEGERLNQV